MLTDPTVNNRLYQELTSFNYPYKKVKGDGSAEHEIEYGMNPMKESVFVQNVADELFN
jgi:hypothetical protein